MNTYLPWWITGISLGAITLSFYLVLHRTLGVSGSWARVVMGNKSDAENEADDLFRNNPKMFNDALMTATIEEFGKEEVVKYINSRHSSTTAQKQAVQKKYLSRSPRSAHIVFLLMLIVGGLIGSIIKNDWSIQFTLGELHTSLFGTGIASPMMLFFGGVMVGFGTQMAGGCTSGHGLSGVSRFVPSSMAATAVFFASAIIFSMIAHQLGV